MQTANNDSMDSLREYAKELGSEPSEFINMLSKSTGKAVWLLNKDLVVMWHSDNTNAVTACVGPMCGLDYITRIPELSEVFSAVCVNKTTQTSFMSRGVEFEIESHPINTTDGVAAGYIVTLSKGHKAKLDKLLVKIEKRNNDICSIQQRPSLLLSD